MNMLVRTGFSPANLSEAMQFAKMLSESDMVPAQYRGKPANVIVAIQWGAEVGLGPLQALQNIAVINGKPSIYGDAALALVRGSGICESVDERMEGQGETRIAICTVKRKGQDKPIVGKFSVSDAKLAGLWGKRSYKGEPTPWVTYPERMLAMRARGFALRDGFADVLKGVITIEEAQDIPPDNGEPKAFTVAGQPKNVTPKPEAPHLVTHVKNNIRKVMDDLSGCADAPTFLICMKGYDTEIAAITESFAKHPAYWSAEWTEEWQRCIARGSSLPDKAPLPEEHYTQPDETQTRVPDDAAFRDFEKRIDDAIDAQAMKNIGGEIKASPQLDNDERGMLREKYAQKLAVIRGKHPLDPPAFMDRRIKTGAPF